jgi:hypothetical protein
MSEIFIVMSVLSALTLLVTILYSKRIVDAHKKYKDAKNVVNDIIVSFNKQLQMQEDRLETSTRKISVLSSCNKLFAERLENQKKEVQTLANQIESFSDQKKVSTRISVLENRFDEVASMKDNLLKKIAEIEKQRLRRKDSEAEIKSAIPIKRERVLAPLTTTELTVLEFLAVEGEKTAPEIKEQIKLSREHTARLMKKLYEKGYLERSAKKIPFTYKLKEEMQKILKKPEQKS